MKTTKLYLSISMFLLLLFFSLTAYARNQQIGFSPDFQLLSAAARGDFDGVSHTLYRGGADINTRDRYGWTALMWATYGGHTDIVRLLLRFRPDVNMQNVYGGTALMTAAYQGYTDIVEVLLFQGGAHIHLRDYCYNKTALMWAKERGHFESIQLLQRVAGTEEQLARTSQKRAYLKLMPVPTLSFSASPPPIAAAPLPSPSYALLADSKAYFMLAAANGDIDKIQALLNVGVDINSRDEYGKTALMYAAENEEVHVVEYLLDAGADVKIRNKEGQTALRMVKDELIRNLLTQYGAR